MTSRLNATPEERAKSLKLQHDFMEWHYALPGQCFSTDVDCIEWRLHSSGMWKPVAVLHITRPQSRVYQQTHSMYDSKQQAPSPAYQGGVLKGFRQAPRSVWCKKVADGLGCPDFIILTDVGFPFVLMAKLSAGRFESIGLDGLRDFLTGLRA